MRSLLIGGGIAIAAFASPAMAAPGDMLIKLRGGYVLHPGSSRVAIDIDEMAVVAKPKGSVSVEAAMTLFLTNNFAAEFAFGGSSYDLNDDGQNLSSSGLITPSVTLQFHPMPGGTLFRPYIGAGVAYANFYSEKAGELLTDRVTPFPVTYATSMKGALAPVGQIGADIAFTDQFYINIDAKYLGSNSKFRVREGDARQTFSHKMRAVIIGAGVGFRF